MAREKRRVVQLAASEVQKATSKSAESYVALQRLQVFADVYGVVSDLVHPKRFELLTPRFVVLADPIIHGYPWVSYSHNTLFSLSYHIDVPGSTSR